MKHKMNRKESRISRGLLIRSPHIERILGGRKTWEIRSSATQMRERIALIRSGSGQIVGTCNVVGVVGPLSLADLKANARKAGFRAEDITSLPYGRRTFAWVLKDAVPLKHARHYTHPSGAVIWVKLPPFTP